MPATQTMYVCNVPSYNIDNTAATNAQRQTAYNDRVSHLLEIKWRIKNSHKKNYNKDDIQLVDFTSLALQRTAG